MCCVLQEMKRDQEKRALAKRRAKDREEAERKRLERLEQMEEERLERKQQQDSQRQHKDVGGTEAKAVSSELSSNSASEPSQSIATGAQASSSPDPSATELARSGMMNGKHAHADQLGTADKTISPADSSVASSDS